jgi:histidyl-tRNA synthetase
MATFRAPKGAFDWLPPQSENVLLVREALAAPVRAAGYGYVETPTFEDTALFVRGVGESTDVVSKEMYTFDTRGGESVTLRPEGTAPVLRAAIEAGLHRGQLPVKLWYSGSYFRYERPQKGRYRHFSQVGAEALGVEDPLLDAELIVLARQGYRALGLRRVTLLLNSLGCRECRPVYRERLQTFLAGIDLDEATRQRAAINPLRVLDDKRPEVQALMREAPLLVDSLCADCRAFHDVVRRALTAAGEEFIDEPRLVRGLDYYTRTTFEFVHDGLGSQSAVGGGGRYDGLAESIGGPEGLTGVGWALGVDRTLLAMAAEGVAPEPAGSVAVYVVPLGDAAREFGFDLVTTLRTQGVSADMAFGSRGLKGAMKGADRSGARLAVIVGDRDLAAGETQVKDLVSGEQTSVALDHLVSTLKEQLP